MTRKYVEFKADIDERKDVVFKVYEPLVEDYKEAAKVRNAAFVEALQSKAPLRGQLNTLLRNRGEWDDEREEQYNTYTREILQREKLLKVGGIKLSRAKELALEIREFRQKMRALLTDRSSLDSMTAEGQADNAHFNALVSSCLVYNDENGQEKRYFENVDEYLAKGASTIALTAAQKLAEMMYSIGDNVEKALVENQFLLKWKFVDEKLRLINTEGKLVDNDGRLIDENGYYIDNDGNHVDKLGNRVNEQGEYIVDSKPFLDDDGNELIN